MEIEILNKTYNQSLILSHSSYPFFLDEDGVDWGTCEADFSTVTDVAGYGVREANVKFEEREISIEGYITAYDSNTVEDYKKQLNRLINPLHELELISGDYKITVKAENSVKYSTKWRENNEVLCKFVLDFVAFYPFFRYKWNEVARKSEAQGTALFPLVIDVNKGKIFGRIPYNNINNIFNEGDIQVGFELVVEAKDGPIKYLKGINNKTKEQFYLQEGLEQGEKFIISTQVANKYVKKYDVDGVETDVTNKLTRDSDFWQILPGKNDLDFESDNNYALSFYVKYSPAFLEVLG